MLRRQIVTPIRLLSTAATGVTQGSFDHALQVTSNDEIGQLQRDFNTMVTTIQQEIQRRDEQMMIAQTARSEAEAARTEVAKPTWSALGLSSRGSSPAALCKRVLAIRSVIHGAAFPRRAHSCHSVGLRQYTISITV